MDYIRRKDKDGGLLLAVIYLFMAVCLVAAMTRHL